MLDHDDFVKARKAVMISSMVALFLSRLQFKSVPLSLGNFSIEVGREQLIGCASLALLYFLYAFCWQLQAKFWGMRAAAMEKALETWGKYRDETIAEAKSRYAALGPDSIMKVKERLREIETELVKKQSQNARIKKFSELLKEVLLEVVPPTGLAMIALYSIGLRPAFSFLFPGLLT